MLMRWLLVILLALLTTACGACASAAPPPAAPAVPTVQPPAPPPVQLLEEQCGGLAWGRGRTPIAVGLVPATEAAGWAPAVEAAVDWWGDGLVVNTSSATADVLIRLDPSQSSVAITWMVYNPTTCQILQAVIVLPATPGPAQVQIVAHEIGHMLGLAHDLDDEGSLMYPTYREAVLRPDDRARLRALY